jgi:hypothetical protein
MAICTALKASHAVAIMLTVAVAAVATAVTPAEAGHVAGHVIRDHRQPITTCNGRSNCGQSPGGTTVGGKDGRLLPPWSRSLPPRESKKPTSQPTVRDHRSGALTWYPQSTHGKRRQ